MVNGVICQPGVIWALRYMDSQGGEQMVVNNDASD